MAIWFGSYPKHVWPKEVIQTMMPSSSFMNYSLLGVSFESGCFLLSWVKPFKIQQQKPHLPLFLQRTQFATHRSQLFAYLIILICRTSTNLPLLCPAFGNNRTSDNLLALCSFQNSFFSQMFITFKSHVPVLFMEIIVVNVNCVNPV